MTETKDTSEEGIKELLDVVIATKEEELWQRTKEATKKNIENLENDLIINRELLKVAQEKTKGLNLN